ncbi:hypothetical protein QF035_009102 [Streptomyces umbrinus]|uniref:Uncharacterized protein n=1 Tax=Streptomyces umbrinus TaxID=67370 RepID=A0ABU0T6T1_9ACTN|nr:hypothetical protein [Streptomyces umbrinus]MDQ1031520.1 hypothetical protein [Streptomyces umbrinus]
MENGFERVPERPGEGPRQLGATALRLIGELFRHASGQPAQPDVGELAVLVVEGGVFFQGREEIDSTLALDLCKSSGYAIEADMSIVSTVR